MPGRRAWRFAVPFALVAALFACESAYRAWASTAPPQLPAKTTAEVLAAAAGPHRAPRSGSFVLTTHLGLPNLGSTVPGGGSASSTLGLASGTSRARVWTDGGQHRRLALLQPLQETDWVRDGAKTWVWRSVGERATLVASPSAPTAGVLGALTAGTAVEPPDELAARILAVRDRSTRTSSLGTTHVAGRAAYQVSVAPGTSGSLVERVVIAIDARTGLPLRVAVFVHTQTTPVIDGAYTDLSYSSPSPSSLAFRPPKTATVRDATTPEGMRQILRDRERSARRRFGGDNNFDTMSGADAGLVGVTGQGWTQVYSTTGISAWRLRGIWDSGKSVSGRFGSGRLIRTPLVTLLVLNDGRIAAGAVTPHVLEAAMSQ
jgi:hypothetical protein